MTPHEIDLTFTLNGRPVTVRAPSAMRLLDLLRERLRLTGSKEGCGEGECGACTVLMNGHQVNSCLVVAAQVEGAEIVSVEGIAPHAIQDAFVKEGAVQCGYCIPGFIVSAAALLERNGQPTRRDIDAALGGNLCRCTGYMKIIKAVEAAAAARRTTRA